MTITMVGLASAGELASVHQACFRAGWSADAMAGLIRSQGVFALADDPINGFILMRVAADEAEVLTLAVMPAGRRRGLGVGLLSAGETHVRAQGVATVFLEVAADNLPAIGLYCGRGFEQAGRRRSYYPRDKNGGVDALILRKPLSAPT